MVRFLIAVAFFFMPASSALLAQRSVHLPVQSGDSLLVELWKMGSYRFRLLNRHTPAGDLNDWHLNVLTSGVELGGLTGSSKWQRSQNTPTSVSYTASPGSEIHPGDTGVIFIQGFVNIPEDGLFEIEWHSTLDGATVYSDTLTFQVEIEERGDAFIPTSTGDCCFNFTLKNDHLPIGLLNGLQLSIISDDVAFRAGTVAGTVQWPLSVESSTTIASFEALPGLDLLPGSVQSGFKACFDNIPATGLFEIGWYTLLDSIIVYRDTLELQCEPTTNIELIPCSRPSSFILHQNYPNPFNPSTAIEFSIPEQGEVHLGVYDHLGREVAMLADGNYNRGMYRFHFDGSDAASGMYVYRLSWNGTSVARKMVLLR